MKIIAVIILLVCSNCAYAGSLEYDISNSAWAGVVTSGSGSPKVYGYIARKFGSIKNNSVEDPVIVTGNFYGKGMVLVIGTAANGTPVREILTITSMHNPRD